MSTLLENLYLKSPLCRRKTLYEPFWSGTLPTWLAHSGGGMLTTPHGATGGALLTVNDNGQQSIIQSSASFSLGGTSQAPAVALALSIKGIYASGTTGLAFQVGFSDLSGNFALYGSATGEGFRCRLSGSETKADWGLDDLITPFGLDFLITPNKAICRREYDAIEIATNIPTNNLKVYIALTGTDNQQHSLHIDDIELTVVMAQ